MSALGSLVEGSRSRLALIAVLAVAGLLVGAVVATRGGSGTRKLAVEMGDSSVTTAHEPIHLQDAEHETTTTVPVSMDPTTTTEVDATPSTTAIPTPPASGSPAPISPPPSTTTTICADSFDPGCGPFRWNRSVGANRPLAVSIELLTEDPVAGQEIEFRVQAIDPDATPIFVGSPWKGPVGYDHHLNAGNCYLHGVYEGFGPWTPPAARPGSIDTITGSRSTEPGTVRFTFCIASMSWAGYEPGATDREAQSWCPGDPTILGFEGFTCRDPYGSFAAPYIDVVVAPAP